MDPSALTYVLRAHAHAARPRLPRLKGVSEQRRKSHSYALGDRSPGFRDIIALYRSPKSAFVNIGKRRERTLAKNIHF